mmetsp:Transcript_24602/g.36463  ORF Transcript_24602/g.36463 Transcript_24602/m.36463 type:complete len:211 (-) Transcript_24602:332-964(-)
MILSIDGEQGLIPPGNLIFNIESCFPSAGRTSSNACSKSATLTFPSSLSRKLPFSLSSFSLSSSFIVSTDRARAKLAADLTRPAISAPVNFSLFAAKPFPDKSSIMTAASLLSPPASLICLVWILKISLLPDASGNSTLSCTSSLPGLSNAGSNNSGLFVRPTTNILFASLTPSILDKSWFTTESRTPVVSLEELPLFLAIASISSRIII